MLLKLEPKKWIINDINKDLINIWKSVKKYPGEIIESFIKFGEIFINLSKENKKILCKKMINKIERMKYNIDRASTYLLMTSCAYMGIIIKNNEFKYLGMNLNIYKDSYSFLKETYYNNLNYTSNYLNNSNGKIYNKSYEQILNKAKKGDFVFLDPPYIENHDYQFNYNKNEVLDNKFILNLYKEVKKLDKKEIKWLMTQADTVYIKEIFKEYTIKKFKVYRSGKKEYVDELMIMNYII